LTLAKDAQRIFDRSKFKVTHDISPTISGWLLVFSSVNVLVRLLPLKSLKSVSTVSFQKFKNLIDLWSSMD